MKVSQRNLRTPGTGTLNGPFDGTRRASTDVDLIGVVSFKDYAKTEPAELTPQIAARRDDFPGCRSVYSAQRNSIVFE